MVFYSSSLQDDDGHTKLKNFLYSPQFLQTLFLFTFVLIFIVYLTSSGFLINYDLIRHK
jgi:hypothetical protein